jgi:hypothetical protein
MFIVYGKIGMSRQDPLLELKVLFLIRTLIVYIFPQPALESEPGCRCIIYPI